MAILGRGAGPLGHSLDLLSAADREAMASHESLSTERDHTAALIVDFSDTARELFEAGGAQETLAELVRLAVATIEGCDFAGVFLLEGEVVTTPVHTDPLAADVDMLQHGMGEGPCLDAIADGAIVYADDLSDDPRWTRFGPRAADHGVRSVLAVPLAADHTVGALNLYAQYPRAFGVIDRARGVLLAGLAGVAFTSAQTHEASDLQSDNLRAALSTREMIGQAQGILMERERVTAQQAFDILRRASQHLNIRLREVAQSLVDTGQQPEAGQ